eukprot:CAMPEP_0174375256 /NCGR_PEP_ID=MMETSP0811_2-20130205/113932_1 /TAXON_ID=73025 ORGANISM="Eutreptiella gymnastica-like, Strain CCMP1594" /NCGR_SAMPLE_ID=MMETSP0811_2 /ASSEMBLY_ACC=CAM_ASM_000667 /LENGTH=70 /DNA_ID=CAMNT_0015525315 /DNA_START=33 /DNA_END=245 /DNA_ORIENTATION=+
MKAAGGPHHSKGTKTERSDHPHPASEASGFKTMAGVPQCLQIKRQQYEGQTGLSVHNEKQLKPATVERKQ